MGEKITYSIKKPLGNICYLLIVFLLICINSFNSNAIVILQFNNGGANGAYLSGGTGAGTVGAIYQWPNVGTEGGITIKAKVQIIAITGGATLTTIDGTSTAADWEPQIAGPTIANGGAWSIRFQVRFYNATTNAPYNLSSFRAQAIDIDGGGVGSTLREFDTFTGADSYTLETPSDLVVSTVSDGIKFRSSANSYNGISILETQYIASNYYTNVNNFYVTCGINAVGGSVTATNRLFSMNFRNVVVFTAPVVTELPIELISFNGTKIDDSKVELDWSTATEINNDFFTIERLNEQMVFTTIDSVSAAGTSFNVMTYKYTDVPRNEILYYRLKQTDFDGKFSYSEIISVDCREHPREIISKSNLFGQEVNELYRGVIVIKYSDGTSETVIQ